MSNDPSAALLTLTIVVGSLWLAVDYGRQRACWFAWPLRLLFVLLMEECCLACQENPDGGEQCTQ